MEIFGRDHFWLELQRNGIEIQTRVNESLARIHARTGIPLVATNDIHYLRSEDCHAHDVLLCINTGSKRAEEKRIPFRHGHAVLQDARGDGRHVPRRRRAPCARRWTSPSRWISRSSSGVTGCRSSRPIRVRRSRRSSSACSRAGMARLYPGDQTAARQRLEYERRVIAELGFVSYFLIVWDLIRWARENGIPVGPGRGSAAGSIVAYLLGITKVDPLRYDLLFERFLNSARVSMPDIDIDFCKDGRPRVLEYTRSATGRTASRRSSRSTRWPRARSSATSAARSTCRSRRSNGSRRRSRGPDRLPRSPRRSTRTRI
jgi:DNA polymerase-3 subunit alpha